jgi:hypothetical protein
MKRVLFLFFRIFINDFNECADNNNIAIEGLW